MLGWQELLIVLLIAVLLFGGTKLAGLGRASGKAIREFREETEGLNKKDKEKQVAQNQQDQAQAQAQTQTPQNQQYVQPQPQQITNQAQQNYQTPQQQYSNGQQIVEGEIVDPGQNS